MKLLTGNSNKTLSQKISKYLKTKLVHSSIKKFADGEIYIEINENIRGNSIFLIQSVSSPANDNLMELLLCIDALKRSSAKNITAVIPYFGYARQDRKVAPRTSISAKLVSNLICVAPDVVGVERTRALARKLDLGIAIIDKRRPVPGKSQVMNVVGNVNNKTCIIVDDIIDSGGTIVNAAQALINRGAREVHVYITLGVLSGEAVKKIIQSKIKNMVVTDTIDNSNKVKKAKNIEVLSISNLLGEAIKRISNSTSVSDLFK